MSPVYPFDDAATARAAIDGYGILLEWNAGAQRLLGWSAAEMVGRSAGRLLVRGTADAVLPPVGPRWYGTVALRHRDGRTVRVWLLAHRRESPHGGPDRWLVYTPLEGDRPVSSDDTLSRAALAQAPCAVAVYDERLRLYRVNDAMADVIGLPEERIRGLRMPEIGGKVQNEELERHMVGVLTTGQPQEVRTYLRAGGEDRAHAWLIRMAPITDPDGRVRGVGGGAAADGPTKPYPPRGGQVNETHERIGPPHH
ncbi:PAS domain-containing protein, partial [Streptomyces sp. NPDC000987]|uniref:PAS domain-containing protein n=1 Tax=Streptomyces sp. NPDC000987 TaxID=3154374 RepID=UPI0033169BCC